MILFCDGGKSDKDDCRGRLLFKNRNNQLRNRKKLLLFSHRFYSLLCSM